MSISPLFDTPAQPVPAPAPARPAPRPMPETFPQAASTQMTTIPTHRDVDQLLLEAKGLDRNLESRILTMHKASDAGEMGEGLNDLILASKGLNPREQSHSLVGRLMTRVRGEKEQLLAHTQSVRARINALEAELRKKSDLQRNRIADIERMKSENQAFRERARAVEPKLEAWLATVNSVQGGAPEEVLARRNLAARIQVAIEDMKTLDVLGQQRAISLQTLQDTSRGVVDEFERVRTQVIPVLTQLAEQQLVALEQRQALASDQMARDVVNSALKQAAATLGENQVQLATLQNTTVISVDTLVECQNILEQAARKVSAIEVQGAQQRQLDAQKRADLERRISA